MGGGLNSDVILGGMARTLRTCVILIIVVLIVCSILVKRAEGFDTIRFTTSLPTVINPNVSPAINIGANGTIPTICPNGAVSRGYRCCPNGAPSNMGSCAEATL